MSAEEREKQYPLPWLDGVVRLSRNQVDAKCEAQGLPLVSDDEWESMKAEGQRRLEKQSAEDNEAAAANALQNQINKRYEFLRADEKARERIREEDQEASGIDPDADWKPTPVWNLSRKPLLPYWGMREDKACCFYRGKLNLVFGESESAKTWLALIAVVQVANAGGNALIIDFEDSGQSIAHRLSLLSLDEDNEHRVTYVNPHGAMSETARQRLLEDELPYVDLVMIDATSEGMAAYGLSSNSDVDVAAFYAELPKWCARQGPAVVLIDHTPKSSENRGGPQGSQHKRAGVDGCALYVESVEKFTHLTGHSRIWVNKDKHAGVRATALEGGLWADLTNEPGAGFRLQKPTDPTAAKLAKAAENAEILEFTIEKIVEEKGLIPYKEMRDELKERRVVGSNEAKNAAYKAYRDSLNQ